MSIGTRVHTWLFGEFVGSDEQGNRYYRDRRTKGQKRERRWVLYAGEAEASRVPPEWHAWLHFTIDRPPAEGGQKPRFEQPHQPNLTGSAAAYHPAGSLLGEGTRAKATGDYEPWRPS